MRTTYEDNDLSAYKRKTVRPEFRQMLEDLKAGRIDGVVAWDIDRFTRRPREGKLPGGRAPYGWNREDRRTLVPDEAEKPGPVADGARLHSLRPVPAEDPEPRFCGWFDSDGDGGTAESPSFPVRRVVLV
ncbi:recombinase family protein [Streptomyces sp. NPDC127079]|uniref:recombinase family protein n=1 Tax=Streptomyces sp. NPDC127079 TaxID=3347132 RepID=UPI00364FA52A